MAFIAHLRGPGDGCDYTIGCNQKLITLPNATTLEEAQAEIFKEYGDCMTGREPSVSVVTIYDCTSAPFKVDVQAFLRKIADEEAAERRIQTEQNERAEFERLKNKFG